MLKSMGKLFVPTTDLQSMCEACDKLFDNFQGNGLRICDHPFDQLWKAVLKEYPSFPMKIVNLYCRVKFYARLRQLNQG